MGRMIAADTIDQTREINLIPADAIAARVAEMETRGNNSEDAIDLPQADQCPFVVPQDAMFVHFIVGVIAQVTQWVRDI